MTFISSFNFVPAHPRVHEDPTDGLAVGHGRHHPDRWSGTLPITIEARTPLLLPDHSNRSDLPIATGDNQTSDLRVLGVRTDPDGAPLLDGSAVKGMLRTAFEAVTGSRMGVLAKHDERLGYRATSQSARFLKAARVKSNDGHTIALRVVNQLSPTGVHLRNDPPATAPWVPRRLATAALLGPATITPQAAADRLDGREVWAWLRLLRHVRARHIWQVFAVADSEAALDRPPNPPRPGRNVTEVENAEPVKVRGYLHWTGALPPNPNGPSLKHDERLVVVEVLDGGPAQLQTRDITLDMATPSHRALVETWELTIDAYEGLGEQGPNESGGYVRGPSAWRGLPEGRTLHVVRFGRADGELQAAVAGPGDIRRLIPAMISRGVFPTSPNNLLDDSRRPAAVVAEMSSADWVFGWVAQDGHEQDAVAGHRGHLRVDPPQYIEDSGGVVNIRIPLPTLNSPKPSDARAYVRNVNGQALTDGAIDIDEKTAFLPEGQELSGWKVYEFDARLTRKDEAKEYWTPPERSRLSDVGCDNQPDAGQVQMPAVPGREVHQSAVRHREYIAPNGYKPDTTVGIKGWAAPGTTFSTTLHVDNLTKDQLGALLWLVENSAGDFMLRLGLGKPLGFGVVKLSCDLDSACIRTGEQHRRHILLGAAPSARDPSQTTAALEKLRDGFNKSSPNPARDAFRCIASGVWHHPVHSPRSSPAPQTESYKWWVANKGGQRQNLAAVSPHEPDLKDREDARELPIDARNPQRDR